MSQYKNKPRRGTDWNYGGKKWKLSRSKIDLFAECKRCFYIDNVLGVPRPKMPSFTLNVAVDALLKKEFDALRARGEAHPLMKKYGVDAIPYAHIDINTWRENFVGIQYFHEDTGFLITGAIDDVWVNPEGELIVVDYKATSKDGKVDSLDDSGWQNQYKRQMEIYQWLLRKKGFKVSNSSYFVYVNGRKDLEAFDGKLEFDVTLIEHIGNDSWIDDILIQIKKCLDDDRIPSSSPDCDYCKYTSALGDVLRENAIKNISPKKVKGIKLAEEEKTSKKKIQKNPSLF